MKQILEIVITAFIILIILTAIFQSLINNEVIEVLKLALINNYSYKANYMYIIVIMFSIIIFLYVERLFKRK